MAVESCYPKGIDSELFSLVQVQSLILHHEVDHLIEAFSRRYQKQEHPVQANREVDVRIVGTAEHYELPAVVLLHSV